MKNDEQKVMKLVDVTDIAGCKTGVLMYCRDYGQRERG